MKTVVGALSLILGLNIASGAEPAGGDVSCDVVVYGATPAGIIAAVAVAREGATAVLVEPTQRIGGMVTGGLSRTDVGKEHTVGGYTREFFTRAAARYGGEHLWRAEPHANAETFDAMLREARVTVVGGERLETVDLDGPRITAFTTSGGRRFAGRQFVDSTYEGDLMAAARVSCTVGRESRARYGEPLAGYHPMPIRPRSREVMESEPPGVGGKGPGYVHGTPAAISGVDAEGEPIFGVHRALPLAPGDADGLVQAYTIRLCVTQRPDLLVPFPKPPAYDPERYELLARLIATFPGIRFARIFHPGPIANGKYDLNAQGIFSSDHPGANVGYPEGDAATRQRIHREHVEHVQGMLWFLGHDERVPERLREETQSWGLCRDEFVDNGHWSPSLYVREARRMVGAYVLVQADCQQRLTKPDSVAMGSFLIDCHIVQRILAPDGTVRDEGSFPDSRTKPYQIPFRAITPRRDECENLLVPVCLSASHVAFCSLRMEPVYMALGHAAGVAAVQAMRSGQAVQAIDVAALQDRLREQGAVLEVPGRGPRPPGQAQATPGTSQDR